MHIYFSWCTQILRSLSIEFNLFFSIPIHQCCIPQDSGVEGRVLIFSWKTSKITTCCWTIIDRRMLEPTKKRYPYVQGQRRSCNKMAGGAQSHLKSNLIPTREAWKAQTKPCVHRNQGKEQWPPQETEPGLPVSVWGSPVEAWVSSCLPWGQGL